ncbi:GTPase Era [Croceicoccus sp. Ery5]|uniref:GTPase Era n=1 Tax=Croceicoccus sp. Ery5 TaxID=1703340 RepID=UPI001E2F97F4|nr:GTPase Era [Croceicoccus sp. Ery5]
MDETTNETAATTRCGVVAVLGAPNAGKSTLVNALVGQKVAITSPKAQTTRARLLGIALADGPLSDGAGSDGAGGDDAGGAPTQIVLADTPGIFAPQRRLDRAMVNAAWEGAEAADAILLVIDAVKLRRHELMPLIEALASRPERKLLAINKVDAAKKDALLLLAQEFAEKGNFDEIFFISALTGDGVPELKAHLAAMMPEGPWLYPEDQVSDASQRLLAAEITREQLYRQLRDELPYDSAIRPEAYVERPDGSVEIRQQIVLGRESQKPIVLGKRGARIKAIGEAARAELAELLGQKVHLFLHVKVQENWAEDRELYEVLGLDWVK